jgi:thermostable 8-oxoguanine DNA glycosylase
MVDPYKAINYDRNDYELQEWLLFCIFVPGKKATTTAAHLEEFLQAGKKQYSLPEDAKPFDIVRAYMKNSSNFPETLRQYGFGCYNLRARCLRLLMQDIDRGLNLRTCSLGDLEYLPGIGPKTSRMFVMFSRQNMTNMAILDVHILRFLRNKGYDVPDSTPSGSRYQKIEEMFLKEAAKSGKPPADFDLEIWSKYSKGEQ